MSASDRIAYILPTPCGSITVTGPDGEFIPFTVRKNGFDATYESFSGRLHRTEHNHIIAVASSSLKIGRLYRVALSGTQLEPGQSDECTECVCGEKNGWAIAIGAIDHNSWRKTEQTVACARANNLDLHLPLRSSTAFDRSEFVRYDVARLKDSSGFSFELLDGTWEETVFPVAWMEDDHGEGKEAVQFWVL